MEQEKNIILEINRYTDAESFLFELEPGLGFDVLFIDVQMPPFIFVRNTKYTPYQEIRNNI